MMPGIAEGEFFVLLEIKIGSVFFFFYLLGFERPRNESPAVNIVS